MSYTKSERRFKNRLHMRLSHIDLNDSAVPTPRQTQNFIEEMERTNKHIIEPKRHPHKKVKR